MFARGRRSMMGKLIGLIADNHSQTVDGSDVPDVVLRAFDGTDLILHLGDAGSWGTLDRLATVAPVLAVAGGHNGEGPDTRVSGLTRVERLEGLRAGMVHDLVGRGAASETAKALQCKGAPRDALPALSRDEI